MYRNTVFGIVNNAAIKSRAGSYAHTVQSTLFSPSIFVYAFCSLEQSTASLLSFATVKLFIVRRTCIEQLSFVRSAHTHISCLPFRRCIGLQINPYVARFNDFLPAVSTVPRSVLTFVTVASYCHGYGNQITVTHATGPYLRRPGRDTRVVTACNACSNIVFSVCNSAFAGLRPRRPV